MQIFFRPSEAACFLQVPVSPFEFCFPAPLSNTLDFKFGNGEGKGMAFSFPFIVAENGGWRPAFLDFYIQNTYK